MTTLNQSNVRAHSQIIRAGYRIWIENQADLALALEAERYAQCRIGHDATLEMWGCWCVDPQRSWSVTGSQNGVSAEYQPCLPFIAEDFVSYVYGFVDCWQLLRNDRRPLPSRAPWWKRIWGVK